MSLSFDTLTDIDGNDYEYGHCYQDYDDGNETGCGMEYAYYPDSAWLESWHDAVGLVRVTENFTAEMFDALDRCHAECHNV